MSGYERGQIWDPQTPPPRVVASAYPEIPASFLDSVVAQVDQLTEDRIKRNAEIFRLRNAIDVFVAGVDVQHAPEWASEAAKAAGKEPWVCVTCGVGDGSWPCAERLALDELKAAREVTP